MGATDYKGKPLTTDEGREPWNRKKPFAVFYARPSFDAPQAMRTRLPVDTLLSGLKKVLIWAEWRKCR